MRNTLSRLATALVLSATAFGASAQSTTADMNVQIVIEDGCDITTTPPTDMDFGTQTLLTDPIDQTSTITVTCTELAPYNLALDGGTSGDVASRQMTGANGTVDYQLYQDAARSEVWGETVDVDTLASTGTGAAQTHTVYGRVPAQDTPPAGTYTDVVTVSVLW